MRIIVNLPLLSRPAPIEVGSLLLNTKQQVHTREDHFSYCLCFKPDCIENQMY